MSREVLENRLSRAVTRSGLTYDFFAPSRTVDGDLRTAADPAKPGFR